MIVFILDVVYSNNKWKLLDITDANSTNRLGRDDYFKWTVLILYQIGDVYYVFNAVQNLHKVIDL